MANTFAQYHLADQHQVQDPFQQSANQQQQHYAPNELVQSHRSSSSSTSSPPNMSSQRAVPASAINQLQAFALSAPEAAAAAAAAAAAFSTAPFYAAGQPTGGAPLPPNYQRPSVISAATVGKVASAKVQAKRAPAAPRVRPARRTGSASTTATTTDQAIGRTDRPANQTQVNTTTTTTTTTTSRSQRRYAGRASCDCPNCLDLERLRRLGLEPPAGENGTEQQVGGKKLMHVCHHAGCGKEYEKTSHLRAHLRWHTSERMSACRHSDCGKRFSRTDELRKHMKTHHSQPATTTTSTTTTAGGGGQVQISAKQK